MPNTLIWIIIIAALVAAAAFCARLYVLSSADEADFSSASAVTPDDGAETSDISAVPEITVVPDDDFIIDEALLPEDPDASAAAYPGDGDLLPDDSLDLIPEDPDDTGDLSDETDGEDSDDDCAMTGLNWSQTASYIEGCFSFSITPDKNCHRLSGFACGRNGRMTDFDSVKLRDSDWNEIESLLDASDVEEWCPPDDGTTVALDATTAVFELVFADLSSIRVFPPDNDTCDKIRDILLKAAGIR